MILFAFGTRPEYIKVKPIIDNYIGQYKVLFTGQHADLLKDVKVDYSLKIIEGPNRLDSVLSSCLNNDEIFEDIDYVLVQGDTTSVLGIAMAAFHRNIKVIHLEAGLRTHDYNNPFPEEMNRKLVSSLATIHLCPTISNKINLNNEGIHENIYVVGNTVLDSIDKNRCVYGNKVLVTLHRRENHHWIGEFFKNIDNLAEEYKSLEFILPIHPNPNVSYYRSSFKHVNVIEPLPREELLKILKESRLVISDSGGIQEECSYLNKKVIVCRKVTERPESIGIHSFMCKTPSDLKEIFNEHIMNYEVNEPCPYGDGSSVSKIIDIITKKIKNI